MKNKIKLLLAILFGMAVMFVGMKLTAPFEYDYNKDDGTIVFTVDDEIVSDYELLEWRFADEKDYGTTFKVYFEEK